jgi:hypothetical protein
VVPVFSERFLRGDYALVRDERGLYLLLLAVQWVKGPLPADLTKLVRGLNYDPDRFTAEWPTVSTSSTPRQKVSSIDAWRNIAATRRA